MSMITEGEMNVGDIVMIHKTKNVAQMIPTIEGPKEFGMIVDPSPLMGIPLEIKAIDLPYIICGFLVAIPQLPHNQCILDTRLYNFMEVKPEFSDIYKKLYTLKKNPKQIRPLPIVPHGLLDIFGHDEAPPQVHDQQELKFLPPSGDRPDLN